MVIRGQTTTFKDLDRKLLQKKKYKARSTTLIDGLTTEKILNHLNGNLEADIDRLRSRKVITQKEYKNATEEKLKPKNNTFMPLPSIQGVLNDDIEKWQAEREVLLIL